MDALTFSLESLRPLGGGDRFTIVIDDPVLCDRLRLDGVDAVIWEPDLAIPDGTHIALVLCHQPITVALRAQFSDAAVLLVPAVSFDPRPEAVMYTLRLLLSTDFAETCRRNQEWIDLLRWNTAGVLRFGGPNIDLTCQLHEELSAHTSLDITIGKGEWVSVADYCEVSLTPPSQKNWCGAFTIDGVARATGVLVAEDSRVTAEGAERIVAAKRLRDEFVRLSPIDLTLEGGVLRALTVGGRDRLEEVLEVTNRDHGLHAVELGLGSNTAVAPLVDWTFNSQMNEGAAPIHLGFGEGITGAHMDFVLNDAALVP